MKHLNIDHHIKADVLIIGGGLAGMYSALAAAESGTAVRILCKSKTGGSGNSVVAMSVHRFAPDAPDLREDYRRRFLASGAGQQDAEIAAFFVDHAAAAMERLRGLGLPLEYRTLSENGGEYPYLACCSPKQGRILTKAVREKLNIPAVRRHIWKKRILLFPVLSAIPTARRSQRAMLRVLWKQRGPNPRRMVKILRVRHKNGRTVLMSKVWALCRQHGDSQKP